MNVTTAINTILLSSILFYVFNFFTTCHKYSFPYLLYIYKGHCSKLDDVINYALNPEIFDPLTSFNKPQAKLKDVCVITSQKGFTSQQQIKEYLYNKGIFNDGYWSSPYLMNLCKECLINHWLNSSSELNLLDQHNPYNFNEFNHKYDRLIKYIFTNCRFHESVLNTNNTNEANTAPPFLSKPKRLKESQSNTITSKSDSNRILIVGASAGGLITALSMFKSSLFGTAKSYVDMITIIDKRNSYSRQQWFDLIGKPFYNTLDVLFEEFAFDTQNINYVNETNDNLTTVLLPSSVLERFLAKTVYMTGIKIEYNHQYIGYCKGFENIAVILNNKLIDTNNPFVNYDIKPKIWNCGENILDLNIHDDIIELRTKYAIENINTNMFRFEQFSMIIGCDGTHSTVRQIYNMGWFQKNIIDINRFVTNDKNKQISLSIDNLQQTSLLVNFKTIKYSDSDLFDENNPYDSHNCPELIIGHDNRILDPWSASFVVEGVHTVFKRFYYNDCQMQILLDHKTGMKVRNKNIKENVDLLWSIVLNTTKHYLQNAPGTVTELQNKYLVSSSLIEGGGNFATIKKQILFLNHTIILPKRSIKLIKNTIPVLLIGDSSMKAHYRLGVGINRILDSYYEYIKFYYNIKQTMLGKEELINFIVDFTRYIEGKLQYFVEFQASTIFLESYCDFIIFFKENTDDLNEAQSIAIKDQQAHDYIQVSMKQQKKLIKFCIEKYSDVKIYGAGNV
eukprot:174911_1